VRRTVRGDAEHLRIGYLASAARQFLEPAIGAMRRSHPEVKIKLLDLTPGEMISALRRGELDVALTDHAGDLLARDFYTRRVAVVPMLAVLPAGHRLAASRQLQIADLKDETFVHASDADVPGHMRLLLQLCRKCGKFRPKLIGPVESLAAGLLTVVNEGAVGLMPGYVRSQITPCLITIPLADPEAVTDMRVIWQRGKTPAPLKSLLEALPVAKATTAGPRAGRKVNAA
jgi:DNA-binding transcriptional LysR family regulator